MKQADVIVVIRRMSAVVFSSTVVILMALFMIWAIAFPLEADTFWYVFQGLLAVWLILWLIWLVGANPKLVVTTASLEVTNWFMQYSIPWQTVSWIQRTDEIVIHLRDGGKIKPAVGGWSLVGLLKISR
jgi:hypothetical protein